MVSKLVIMKSLWFHCRYIIMCLTWQCTAISSSFLSSWWSFYWTS